MKIEINLKIILVLILFLIIKNINTYLIFIIFILIHELAHLLVGICIGGKPRKLTLSPFGASLEFYTYGNNNSFGRILFFLIGPLVNFIIAFLLLNFRINLDKIIFTNLAIGIFNLLPILPLDGGKIVREILKIFFGIEKSNNYTMLISKIILVIISFFYAIIIIKIKNIMVFFLIIYLWYLFIIEERKLCLYNKTAESIKKANI